MHSFSSITRRLFMGIIALTLFCVSALLIKVDAYADGTAKNPSGVIYEGAEDEYTISGDSKVSGFSYGKKSIGTLTLSGSFNQQTKYKNWNTYLADDTVTFNYKYDGTYQTDVKEDWNLKSGDAKSVDGIKLSGKIKSGTIIIQKSSDGQEWKNATDTVVDFFSDNPNGKDGLYSASVKELKEGTYFRVIVAYQMTRKTGEKQNITWSWVPEKIKDWTSSSEYETVSCVERYEFFLYYGGNPIVLKDIVSGSIINSATVQNGFVINKDGWKESIKVAENGRTATEAKDYASFYEPGEYTIETNSRLGKKITVNIQVTDGLKMTSLLPEVYVGGGKDDYDEATLEEKSTPASIKNYTTLKIGQTGSDDIEQSKRNDGTPVYGISGSGVSIFLNLSGQASLTKNGWEIVADDWGGKKKQNIGGAKTGTVYTGALVVQTSKDGKTWNDIEKDKYANGLTTTDYANNWAGKNDVCIYTPDGESVNSGIYIRVIYAYKAQKSDDKKSSYRSYEKYEFYLCNSTLGAVTFHNLTLDGKLDDLYKDQDENTVEAYKKAETLTSGSETVTGFEIDTSLNPTISYEIERNGKQIAVSTDNRYTDSGRYDIHLKSPAGNQRDVSIYVDPQTNEQALITYFGDSFITGKRIYTEDEYPEYEGGKTSYNISSVSEEYLPVSGQIKNETSGETINITGSRDAKTGKLSSPGEYICTFTTNSADSEENPSGDNRVFTFHFTVIAEGKAPGPVVNKKSLEDYSHSSISDAYPIYYGLTYQSALKGTITLAFASEEAAIEYAYNYEKGTVEKQDDGTYRYTGSSMSQQKASYDSLWDLTDDINDFAEKEVKKAYFDMSDEFTYRTLDKNTLENVSNLRTLELENSIVVFASEEERNQLTSKKQLPLLSPKPYSYVKNPGNQETVEKDEFNDFQFVKDKYGIDSDKVSITDSQGKTIEIQYNMNVGVQLQEAGCATGIVTINEFTKYGDTTSYEALFINSDENTAELTVELYVGDEKDSRVFSQADTDNTVTADAFSIEQLEDKLDPYDLILIKKDGVVINAFAGDENITNAWTDPGSYTIKVINRLGCSFEVNVTVEDAVYTSFSFEGEGTQNVQDILVEKGQHDVSLPVLERKGYTLTGFSDQNGNLYVNEIEEINFSETRVLIPQWEPDQCTIEIQDSRGNVIATYTADYGSVFEIPSSIDNIQSAGMRWLRNGSVLSNSSIKVDDDEIVLTAENSETATEQNDTESDVPQNEESNNKKKSGGSAVSVIIVILAIIIVGLVIREKVKRGHFSKDSFSDNENDFTEEHSADESYSVSVFEDETESLTEEKRSENTHDHDESEA